MLFPRSHVWTPLQKWLLIMAALAALLLTGVGIYYYERFHRGPDESFFVGTWRGEYDPHSLYIGPADVTFRFRPDHTYDADTAPSGKWHAAGDFLFLRLRLDDASGPYDRLEAWHIDSMTANEVHMHSETMYVAMKRSD
jgi:hypothetical protein